MKGIEFRGWGPCEWGLACQGEMRRGEGGRGEGGGEGGMGVGGHVRLHLLLRELLPQCSLELELLLPPSLGGGLGGGG